MVRIYILTLFFSLPAFVNAQTSDTADVLTYMCIEEPPFFNGDLQEFIQENLVYPLTAKRDTVVGVVYISFMIDTSGLTVNHNVVRGIREDVNIEALRIAKLIKFDRPALQKGKPIEVKFTIPVVFELPYLQEEQGVKENKEDR